MIQVEVCMELKYGLL